MYDVIYSIIGHTWVQNDSMQQYILYACIVVLAVLIVTFIDLVYRTFRSFWRK